MTFKHWRVVMHIHNGESANLHAIPTRVGVRRDGRSKMIGRLSKKDHVTRILSSSKRSTISLTLSPKAKMLMLHLHEKNALARGDNSG